MFWPPITSVVIPRSAVSSPNVTMIDGTRPTVTSTPVNNPISVPKSRVSGIPIHSGQFHSVCESISPIIAASSAIREPTEMSISAVTMTSITPQATIAVGAARTRRSRRFPAARKPGSTSVTSTVTAAISTASPASRCRTIAVNVFRRVVMMSPAAPRRAGPAQDLFLVAVAPASSPTSCPSHITRIRSLIDSNSGSSEEMTSVAMPSAASLRISRCTWALAPTSTPRVGSSRISTRGRLASHFPKTTFCWLPPDSVSAATCGPAPRTSSARICSSTSLDSWRRLVKPKRGTFAGRRGRCSLLPTWGVRAPQVADLPGPAQPAWIAAGADPGRSRVPATET